MNLNEIDIELAERTNPQAVNLGFVTARRYFLPLFSASCLAILPLLLLACLIAYFYQAFTIASLLLWWGKPYISRVILLNASRLLFREKIGATEIFGSLKQALKDGLWLNLTFFRLSLARCLTLPIMVLEQLSGKEYRRRVKLISRGAPSTSAVTIGLLHFEWFLYLNVILGLFMLLPDSVSEPFGRSFYEFMYYGHASEFHWLLWLMLPAQALCSAIIEVFYVMTGFMMYLNSRIKTEGWHIELAFKQIAERLQASKNNRNDNKGRGKKHRAAMSWLFAVGLGAVLTQFPMQTAVAQTAVVQATSAQSSSQTTNPQLPVQNDLSVTLSPEKDKQILKTLLQKEAPFVTKGKWVAKTRPKRYESQKSWDMPNLSNFASVLKIILIVGGLLLIYWMIANRDRFIGMFQGIARVQEDLRPTVMFGLDIRKESLPKDIVGEAQRLLQQGDLQAVLSLLYRGSLASLVHDYDIDIKESDTEGDCLQYAEPHTSLTTFTYFKRLTQRWQSAVYAHRPPGHAEVEQLIKDYQPAFPHQDNHQDNTRAKTAVGGTL